ncbi:ATP-binding protein [Oenococcus oeni]
MVGLFVMPSSTIFRQHTRLNAATNKTTKKISHTRRSPKDRNYPSTPFDKLPFLNEKSDVTIEYLEKALDFVFSEEEVLGNRQARSFSQGLVTQLHNLKDKYSNNLFNAEQRISINDILHGHSGIIVIDVSQIIDDDGLKLFSNFVSRHLFEKNRQDPSRENNPVYLIFDEAHRYIKEGAIADDSIFNRIAREGRKFGINLTVISQIPSELSRVVLSQTSTFIIHRIQNSLDLDYIRKNVPAISNDQVFRLPYFSPGTAAILGSSMKIPMEIKVDGTFKDATPLISMRK